MLLLSACSNTPEANKVPTGAATTNIELIRLDQALFGLVESHPGTFHRELQERHGSLYSTLVEDVLQAGPMTDPRTGFEVLRFATDPDWKRAQASADSVFGTMAAEQALFNAAFTRLHHFFPDSLVPRVAIFNSGYNYGIIPADSVLGVGIEWFIGPQDPVIKLLPPETFPQYMRDRMRPEMLVPAAVKGWLLVHYTRDIRGADLLTNLVETGKVLALLDALMPGTDAAAKFAFTHEQLAWCEKNEFRIWQEIVSNELLFKKDNDVLSRFMNDAPFTPSFPKESPGHIGEWIGFRMVSAYLRARPEATYAELFALDDPMAVLKYYKPR